MKLQCAPKTASLWQRLIIGRSPRRTALRTVLLAVTASLFFGRVLRPAWVHGESMAPTIRNQTLHFVYLLRYACHDPQPGEIVAVRMAGRRIMYLKRVLATGGDRIEFRNGQLWINGVIRPEPYVYYTGAWTINAIHLADDEYFVAGDNRAEPLHAHVAGIVQRQRIVGGLRCR